MLLILLAIGLGWVYMTDPSFQQSYSEAPAATIQPPAMPTLNVVLLNEGKIIEGTTVTWQVTIETSGTPIQGVLTASSGQTNTISMDTWDTRSFDFPAQYSKGAHKQIVTLQVNGVVVAQAEATIQVAETPKPPSRQQILSAAQQRMHPSQDFPGLHIDLPPGRYLGDYEDCLYLSADYEISAMLDMRLLEVVVSETKITIYVPKPYVSSINIQKIFLNGESCFTGWGARYSFHTAGDWEAELINSTTAYVVYEDWLAGTSWYQNIIRQLRMPYDKYDQREILLLYANGSPPSSPRVKKPKRVTIPE